MVAEQVEQAQAGLESVSLSQKTINNLRENFIEIDKEPIKKHEPRNAPNIIFELIRILDSCSSYGCSITKNSFEFESALFSNNCLILFLLTELLSQAAQSDVDCLRAIKDILDPLNKLASLWNFNKSTEGYICKFTGVECWHENENKVLNIRLPDIGLKGEFPQAISGCSSMTGLDLSSNNINGTIPTMNLS
ncbi:hypothetical protein ACP275_03G026400 [Erythranthe tilingii]